MTSTGTQDFSTEPVPQPTDDVDTTPSGAVATPGLATSMALAGVLALTVNFIIYGAGRALDVDFTVVSYIGMREEIVGPQGIVTMTVVGWALGTGLLLGLRHRPRAWPALAVTGAVLALVSVPFFNVADVSTKVTLGLMHLTTGGLWVLALRRLRPVAR